MLNVTYWNLNVDTLSHLLFRWWNHKYSSIEIRLLHIFPEIAQNSIFKTCCIGVVTIKEALYLNWPHLGNVLSRWDEVFLKIVFLFLCGRQKSHDCHVAMPIAESFRTVRTVASVRGSAPHNVMQSARTDATFQCVLSVFDFESTHWNLETAQFLASRLAAR